MVQVTKIRLYNEKNFYIFNYLESLTSVANGTLLFSEAKVKLKVAEHNFGGNFKSLTNLQDFCVLLRNLMVHWTINFKLTKFPGLHRTGAQRLLESYF